jgi:hypothetical protein
MVGDKKNKRKIKKKKKKKKVSLCITTFFLIAVGSGWKRV